MKFFRSNVLASVLLAGSASASLVTNMTAIETYDESSCAGAPVQVIFTQVDGFCSNVSSGDQCAVESEELGLFASASCTKDTWEYASTTFGDIPYVLVEIYEPQTHCKTLEGVAAYRIDNTCHPTLDIGTSFKVVYCDDKTPTLKLFADETCSKSLLFEVEVPTDTIDRSECHRDNMKFYVSGLEGSSSDDSVANDSASTDF